jgi:putative ABC transport system permease protein
MGTVRQDAKFGVRMLKQNPAFTAMAVLTLALGVGANTAIFSVMNAVLLRPFSYPDPGRLVAINAVNPPDRANPINVSFTKFTQIKEQSKSLQATAAYYPFNVNLATRSEAEQVAAARVSLDFFPILGAVPIRGRAFLPQEDQPGGPDVVLISDGFWHSHFGADPELLGKSMTLDGKSVTVIGILPATFSFPVVFPEPHIWFPRVFETTLVSPELVHSGAGYLSMIARMRQGETLPRVQAELDTINSHYKQEFGSYADASKLALSTISLEESVVGPLRPSLLVLLAAVGFVLLIACANVASMLLVKATTRQKEIAIRRALGATRAQLVRQLLTENLVLSLTGGILGVALASAMIPLSRSIAPGTVPRLDQAQVDLPVLLFSLGLCGVAALAFGLVPALQVSGWNLHRALKEGGRGSSDGAGRSRLRAILVVGEVAMALVLMTGAGLLTRSFVRTLAVNPGFESRKVMTFPIALPAGRYSQAEQQTGFYRRLVEQVKTLPSVEAAAVTTYLPLSGAFRFVFFCPEGLACQGLGKDPLVAVRDVTPAYFQAIHTPLISGRVFTDQDSATSQPVVIVNQAVANHYWPNQDPLRKHLANSRDQIQRIVVGVVANVKFNTLASPIVDEMYLPLPQNPRTTATLIVRSQSDPQSLGTAVRQELGKIDSNLAIAGIQSLDEVVASSVAQPRLVLQFVAVFAGLALLLSAIGIYAVLAYMVSQRKRELGIRMALGAQRWQILRLVLRNGMGLTLVGVACGIAASLALTRLLAGLLFDIRATDPLAFSAAAFLLVVTALLACYVPARKASRLDPIIVLRSE